jgi:hypothetical protein
MTRTISYRLPRAELVVSGTVRRARDKLTDPRPLAEQPTTLVSHAFVVRHVADPATYTVTLPHGWLRTFKGSFSFTSDRRLVSASAESTGQLGTVLTAAATVAGGVLGLGAVKTAAGVALGVPAPQDPVDNQYRQDHPDVHARRKQTVDLLDRLRQAQLALADEVVADPAAATAAARWNLLRRIRRSLEDDLAALDTHFAAWRAGTIETVDESFEFAVPLADLKGTAGEPADAATQSSAEAPKTLVDLWRRYGVGITATWGAGRNDTRATIPPTPAKIVTRIPDLVTLSIVEHRHGVPVVTAASRHLIMDERSQVEYFELEKSLFGRRSLALTFDADGVVTGVAVEGAASLAEAASTVGRLPASVAGGIGSLNTAVSGLATARRAALDAELARIKQQVELEQQRIAQAGLNATATDAARLQRLQQLQAILDTQTAIGKADPRLVAGVGAGRDLDWYQPPADPAAPSA